MYKICRKCSSSGSDISALRAFLTINYSNYQSTELDQGYVPNKLERQGLGLNYFKPPLRDEKPFTLALPPPNITGTLHLGHALTATVEDILVRWKRMQGIETVWVPGIDHAGIATQVVVEKRLWKENQQSRHDLGRQRFQESVWEWKEEKAGVIGEQLRRLNISLDWQREIFTMDKLRSRAVQEAFIRLFEDGLIYRADQLVNWSCVLQSAISDIEVEHISVSGPTGIPVPGYETPVEFGTLTKFAYKVDGRDDEIVVATTRPETMFGDVAIAVHPEDDRYSSLIGSYLWHPFRMEKIPVISDPFVDRDFGTGAVKITPAHDHVDFEAGKRHSLQVLQVIDESGHLTSVCRQFHGLRRFDARTAVVNELEKLGLFRGRQDHQMIVPICSRSKDVIELLVRPQWFIDCSEMAQRALEEVREGRLKIVPKVFEKTWCSWLENIRDWCISRQLWWGHQIPAYSCYDQNNPKKTLWVAAVSESDARRKAAEKIGVPEDVVVVHQDEDVLDTWFSSALQPFAAFGWPQQTEDLSKHYPLSLMETGHDILFFWVARMVMLGTKLTGKLPFDKILLHGIVCDAQGRKMSKSLGNVVAPEDVITGKSLKEMEETSKASHASGVLSEEELTLAIQGHRKMFPTGIPECGSDALRFTLISHNVKNHFINFDINECHTNRLFCNKIWQATKFTNLWSANVFNQQTPETIDIDHLPLMDRWILSRLTFMVDTVNAGLENFDFHVCTAALKNFLYYEFCDVYLETTKRGLRDTKSSTAVSHCCTLSTSLDVSLRALAPFMPVLSHHLHHHLTTFPGHEKHVDFPQHLDWRNPNIENDVEDIMKAVVAIRRLKKIFNISAKHKPSVQLVTSSSSMKNYSEAIQDLSMCHTLTVCTEADQTLYSNSVKDSAGNATIHLEVPEDLLRELRADLPKMHQKKEKLSKELTKMNNMISGKTYKINATAEAQEIHSKKIAAIQEKISRIEYIQNLTQR